jgi:hypothetical protein
MSSFELSHWLEDKSHLKSLSTAIAELYSESPDLKNWPHFIASIDPIEAPFYKALILLAKETLANSPLPPKKLFLPPLRSLCENSDFEGAEEKIDRLREEANLLKSEGAEQVGRGMLEAASSGASAAAGNGIMGFFGGIFATMDIIKGCHKYSEGVRREEEACQIEEEFFAEETEKKWWEFWK